MNFFDPDKGDIVIKQAKNGFVVLSPSESQEGAHDIFVYEFKEEIADENVARADALFSLIDAHFYEVFQTKHHGGLSIRLHHKGRHEEES